MLKYHQHYNELLDKFYSYITLSDDFILLWSVSLGSDLFSLISQNQSVVGYVINILKIGKLKSVGGVNQQSMQRGSTVNTEVINTVDPGGRIDDWHREDQQSTFTFAWKGDHLLILGGGGGLMINS